MYNFQHNVKQIVFQMRTKLFQIRTKATHLHRQVAKYIISMLSYEIIIKTKSIKTLTTVFQSGISLESVKHAHLPIEYPSPLCC